MTIKKLIVFTHGGGRLANQLTNFAHLIAFVEENRDDFDLINIAFWPYKNFFESQQNDIKINYFEIHKNYTFYRRVEKLLSKFNDGINGFISINFIRLWHLWAYLYPNAQSIIKPKYRRFVAGKRFNNLNFFDKESINKFYAKHTTVLAGYPIRNWSLFQKHSQTIRKQFVIIEKYKYKSEEFINNIRRSFDFVIGVLIRQNDYRTWQSGDYFFTPEKYIEWMKQIKDLYADKNVAFVVTSDEKLPIEKFDTSNTFFANGTKDKDGHFMESFCELSLCDLIMTPPSTYGVWAAFFGDIPVFPLCNKLQILSREQVLQNHIFDAIDHLHMAKSIK